MNWDKVWKFLTVKFSLKSDYYKILQYTYKDDAV